MAEQRTDDKPINNTEEELSTLTNEALIQQQSSNVLALLREALQITQDTNQRPLNIIAGLLDPKPIEEWGTNEYARSIRSLHDIEGTKEEQAVARDVRRYLDEQARKNDITSLDLTRAIGTERVSGKTLADFAQELFTSLQHMTPEQRAQKVQELNELRAMTGSKMDEILSIAEFFNKKAQVPQQREPLDPRYAQEMEWQKRQQREHAAELRLYEDEGEEFDFYNGSIHETIEKRFERIIDNPKSEDEDKLREYYADLQKWVGIIIQNDFREDPEDGKLVLKNDRYEKFKQILAKGHESVPLQELIENTKYLKDQNGGRLTTYFRQRNGDGNERVNSVIGYKQEGEPPSLPDFQETMDLIQRQYGSKYGTGGEFELIDIKGQFHLENFAYWARERTNFLKEQNPAGKIDPLSKITIRTLYSEIPLGSILESPQFRKQRKFVITGNEDNENADQRNQIDGHWGREVDHPEFTEDKSLDLLYELAFYSGDHSMAADYQVKRGEKGSFLEVTQQHMNAWVSRGNWTTIFKRPSRKDGTGEEFRAYHEEGKDGTLGRAMREMLVAYNHMTEWTEYYKYQKGDRRLTLNDGVQREVGKRKVFKDNLFYRYLEANGSNGFLLAISSESMKKNTDVVKKYQEFICERLDIAAQKFESHDGLTDDQKKRITQLLERYKKRVSGNGKIDTDFYESVDLQKFHLQVHQQVFGEGKVDKEQIAHAVQEDMLTNLKAGLFEKMKQVEIPKFDKNGRRAGMQTLGSIEIDIDGKKVSVAQALDEFDTDYEHFKKYVWYGHINSAAERAGKPAVYNDPDITSSEFEKYVEKNEQLASVLSEAIAKVSRKELNYFRKSAYFFSKTEIMDAAIQKGIGYVAFELDSVERGYGGAQAKNEGVTFGIAGQNDTTATGFDYWTRITNASDYMEQQSMKAYPIVEPFIKEVKFLGSNMFDMLMVVKPGQTKAQMTLMDVFMGGVGDNFVSRKERMLGPDSMYHIDANAQANVFLNDLKNAADFIDKLRNADFHFDKITTTDFNNNVIIDVKRTISEFTKLWTMIRYSTDQHGMDYTRLMSYRGKIDDVLHHQFGEHSRAIMQEMANTMYPDDPMKIYMAPGIGVFAALVGSVIEEHRGVTYEKRWTIQQINELEYLIGGIVHKDPRVKKFKTRIPPHIWDALLVAHGIGFKKMMAAETGFTIMEALYFAVMEALEDYGEQVTKPLKT